MLFRRAHLLWLLLAAPSAAPACGADSGPALVAGASGGDVALADGRRVRLGGLRLAPAARDALEAWSGRRVGVALLAPAPDRWGRLVADLRDESGRSLALDLVERGLAWVRPEPETRACEAERLEAEAGARAAGEGLWAEPGAILAAGDRPALAAADGKYVLVTGVVRRVGGTSAKVYLDFGGRGGFSVVVGRKAEPQFRRAGVDLQALKGRGVRVRGVVDARFGPRIEVADPLMIELLETDTGRGG